MTRRCLFVRSTALLCGVLTLSLFLPAFSVQTKPDDVLMKKYEKILGKYELDLSTMGGGTRILEYYIKNGALWIEYGFTSPGEMHPVNEAVDKFTFDEPDDGLVKITFLKNDKGEYAQCRFVVDSLNLDVIANKIKT